MSRVEEREDDMSSLTARFVVRTCKRDASAQRDTISGSEGPNDKRTKRSGLEGEVLKIPTMITMDSPERAPNAQQALKGAAQDVPREACISLEGGILAEGPPIADNIMS